MAQLKDIELKREQFKNPADFNDILHKFNVPLEDRANIEQISLQVDGVIFGPGFHHPGGPSESSSS